MNTKSKMLLVVLSAIPVIAVAMSSAEGEEHSSHTSHSHGDQAPVVSVSADKEHGAHGHSMPGMKTDGAHDDHAAMAGKSGAPKNVNRVVEISMDDTMRFTPSQLEVKAGETIRFQVKNNGRLNHEMVIGSIEELKEHAAMMRKMPDMKHAEANMITLAAGQVGGLIWQFDKPGKVEFACLILGHMEAGMKGEFTVN